MLTLQMQTTISLRVIVNEPYPQLHHKNKMAVLVGGL